MTLSQIEQFLNQFFAALPDDIQAMKADIKKQLAVALSATLSKMEIVSREEFDVQARLLIRTRQRLEDMEKKLIALEASQEMTGKTETG